VNAGAPRRLALVALATLAACGGGGPLSSTSPDASGAAGSVTPGPPAPSLPAPGAAGTGGASSGASGSAGAGGATAGTVGAGGTVGTAGIVGTAGTIGTAGGFGALRAETISDFDPVAISASGLVVAGIQKNRAARWTAGKGVVLLPLVGLDAISSTVAAMDREGAVLVGSLLKATTSQAVVWSGTVQALGFARAGDDSSRAVSCSGDGMTVTGTSENLSGGGLHEQAFLWRAGSGMAPVPFLSGDNASEALAISQDGSTVVGFSYDGATSPPRRRAFWWRAGEITIELAPPFGASSTVPRALSADGLVVVGDAMFDAPGTTGGTASVSRAFRWTPAGGVELAAERGDRDQSRAVGISDDGGTIVGLAFTNGQWKDLPIPFRWQPPSSTPLTVPPDDLPVPDVFTDELGTTIVGLGRVYVSSTAYLWRPGTMFYQSLSLGPMPAESAVVALSRNGSVLLGRGRGAAASQVDAWLLPLP
jgi:uncharacterized membrane protein